MTETIYIDHNILDALIKKRLKNLDEYIYEPEVLFIYSNETLIEIRKSKGYEEIFLEKLIAIDAKYLFVESNKEGRITGNWNIRDADPHQEFTKLNDALSECSDSNFGLDELIQKFYSGAQERSFSEIAFSGAEELAKMLDETLESSIDDLDGETYAQVAEQFELLKSQMYTKSAEMGSMFDSSGNNNDVSAWEQAVEVGPLELKNIKGPDIVLKVWEKISKKIPESVTFNKLFGLEPQYEGAYIPQNDIEKSNVVYNGLNYLGYFRDKGMKKKRRVIASLSDMTHVGYASVCSKLISDDKDLCKKAEAVYEYLNIETKVQYANLKNKS